MPTATNLEKAAAKSSDRVEVRFGSNEVRLSVGQWAVALLIATALVTFVPVCWQRIEPLDLQRDWRVPYRLSNDYWTAARYFRRACRQQKTLVIGDSVVWGHYVSKDETLPHYLNQLVGGDRFANLGVDGIHPAALEGLVKYYGRAVTGQRVILHCNLLWISSKRHDLQTDKEFAFNHPTLVPQFFPWIPCYKQSLSARIGIVIGRRVPWFGWTKHLQVAYYENTDLPTWTVEHPYGSPAAPITLQLPSPGEPPSPTPVAQPWTAAGISKFNAAWVDLDSSLQWRCFKRTVAILRRRRNRLFVFVGPFNEHMLTRQSRQVYQQRKRQVEAWLRQNDVPYVIPPVLPSDHYADASHPLSQGYLLLARQLLRNQSFLRFLGLSRAVRRPAAQAQPRRISWAVPG